MDSEEKGQSRYRFLPARKLFHVSEPLHRGHCVVLNTTVIWLLKDSVNVDG
jgi:uncharacterized iron-regulated membrane protein